MYENKHTDLNPIPVEEPVGPGSKGTTAQSLWGWALAKTGIPCILTADPQAMDYVDEIKMRVGDLRPGMFVCELDCPWEDTPFQPGGFEIRNATDVKAVSSHCEYVFIDLERTPVDQVVVDDLPGSYLCENGFCFGPKDLEAAKATQSQTSDLIKSLVEDIRFGQSLDIQLAKAAVSECVSNVLSNPQAMTFLTRIRGKDEYTRQQAYNTCIYSIVLGRLLGLNSFQLEQLGTCGLLHDIGKLSIPGEILNKTGALTAEEVAIVHKHTKAGRDFLMSASHIYSGSVDVAYSHHENLDGTGYPRGLHGDQINLNCKIVSIVDKYEAITSPRPYRPMGDHLSAVAILNKLARENKIDSSITSYFVSYMGVYPPGCIVELSNGEVGIVLESNLKHHLHPRLLIVRDANKQRCQCLIDMTQKTIDERGRPYRIVNVHSPGYYGISLSQYYDLIVRAFS